MSTGKGAMGHVTPLTIVWGILAVAGSILWVVSVTGTDPPRAWRSLLVNFMFFSSLAGGLVVWPAIVRQCNGAWHAGVERLAAGGIAFALPSVLALILLWIGSAQWSPWHGTVFHQGVWLDNSFVFGRNLFALVLFWGLAGHYLRDRRRGKGRVSGAWLIVVYCLVFSLLGLDLVMALEPDWYSTLAGAYFFMSGLYIAITAWALYAARVQAREIELLDLGRLIVAFSLMTTYMMYAHLLPIWYENLPHEVLFVVPRMNFQPWKGISYGLLAVVYFGPLVLLLTERSKRNRWSLGAISLLVLAGMWVERWWLVAPTFDPAARLGMAELSAAAAFAGILAIGLQQFERRMPPDFMPVEKKE